MVEGKALEDTRGLLTIDHFYGSSQVDNSPTRLLQEQSRRSGV